MKCFINKKKKLRANRGYDFPLENVQVKLREREDVPSVSNHFSVIMLDI